MFTSRFIPWRKFISTTVVMAFIVSMWAPYARAQVALPAPGTLVMPTDAFTPAVVRGMTIDPRNPLKLDFLIDQGQQKAQGEQLNKETLKLVNYFLASLAIPEKDLWVNLSPYEGERMINDTLGTTEMGRDLLAQDYMLKQLTSSLMFPEKALGQEFWKRVYAQAQEKFGSSDIPMDTFHKVWIVPSKAVVYTKGNTGFILESQLKVMLESDYLAREHAGVETQNFASLQKNKASDTQDISNQIIREILIPEIEKEVNHGATFATLRQIYNSNILATWFKKNLKKTLLGQVYADSTKTGGIDLNDPKTNEQIYAQYVEAFKKGVFNYIKDDVVAASGRLDGSTETTPRKYFSGGTELNTSGILNEVQRVDASQRAGINTAKVMRASVDLNASRDAAQKYTEERLLFTVNQRVVSDEFDALGARQIGLADQVHSINIRYGKVTGNSRIVLVSKSLNVPVFEINTVGNVLGKSAEEIKALVVDGIRQMYPAQQAPAVAMADAAMRSGNAYFINDFGYPVKGLLKVLNNILADGIKRSSRRGELLLGSEKKLLHGLLQEEYDLWNQNVERFLQDIIAETGIFTGSVTRRAEGGTIEYRFEVPFEVSMNELAVIDLEKKMDKIRLKLLETVRNAVTDVRMMDAAQLSTRDVLLIISAPLALDTSNATVHRFLFKQNGYAAKVIFDPKVSENSRIQLVRTKGEGDAFDVVAFEIEVAGNQLKATWDSVRGLIVEGLGDRRSTADVDPAQKAVIDQKVEKMVADLDGVFGVSPQDGLDLAKKGNKLGILGFEHEKANRMGWTPAIFNWVLDTKEGQAAIAELQQDAKAIREGFDNVIFAGMGGSSLSVSLAKSVFAKPTGHPNIHTLSTTDPTAIKDIVDGIIGQYQGDVKKALERLKIVVISKSGTTAETVSHLQYMLQIYEQFGVSPAGHLIVYTDPGSAMDWKKFINTPEDQKKEMQKLLERLAVEVRYIQLNQKTDVGGRNTAPSTNVFLLPLAIMEPEAVMPVLERARAAHNVPAKDNQYVQMAKAFYALAQQGKDKLTFVVPEAFREIPRWAEQLIEESLGKQGKGVTIYYGEDLTPDMFKQAAANDRVFLRINVGKTETQKPLMDDLTTKGYPVYDINVPDVLSIGEIELGLQMMVLTMGYLWDINTIDQDGVEGYKNETRAIMSQIKEGDVVQVPAEWQSGSVGFGKNLRLYYQPILEAAKKAQDMLDQMVASDDNVPVSPQIQRLIRDGFMTKAEYVAYVRTNVLPRLRQGMITLADIQQEVSSLGADMNNAPAVYAALFNVASRKGFLESAETYSYGRMPAEFAALMQEARSTYSNIFKVPTKLGEGPDINHSHMQNIQDGTSYHLSTFLMPLKALQPSVLPFDANLLRAPTIGTVKALMNAGRNAVLLTIDSSLDELGVEGRDEVKDFFAKAAGYMKSVDAASDAAMDNQDALDVIHREVGRTYERDGHMIIEFADGVHSIDVEFIESGEWRSAWVEISAGPIAFRTFLLRNVVDKSWGSLRDRVDVEVRAEMLRGLKLTADQISGEGWEIINIVSRWSVSDTTDSDNARVIAYRDGIHVLKITHEPGAPESKIVLVNTPQQKTLMDVVAYGDVSKWPEEQIKMFMETTAMQRFATDAAMFVVDKDEALTVLGGVPQSDLRTGRNRAIRMENEAYAISVAYDGRVSVVLLRNTVESSILLGVRLVENVLDWSWERLQDELDRQVLRADNAQVASDAAMLSGKKNKILFGISGRPQFDVKNGQNERLIRMDDAIHALKITYNEADNESQVVLLSILNPLATETLTIVRIPDNVQDWGWDKLYERIRQEVEQNYDVLMLEPITAGDKTHRPVKFGTSGDRGLFTVDFTPNHKRRIVNGVALYAQRMYPGKTMYVGYDPRQGNKEAVKEAARILAANGLKVRIIADESTPVPVLAYLTRSDANSAGFIAFTASHSPYTDGGVKYSPPHGGAASTDATDQITILANGRDDVRMAEDYRLAKESGTIEEMSPQEAVHAYVDGYIIPKLKSLGAWQSIVDYIKANPDFRLVLDPMQGSTLKYFEGLYGAIAKDAGRDFFTMVNDNNNDPEFSTVDGAPNPTLWPSRVNFEKKLKEGQGRWLGSSADADGDRFGNVDLNGEFMSANDMLGLIAYFLNKEIGVKGRIAKTVATSNFVNAIAQHLGVELDEFPVGFKHVVASALEGKEYIAGGEESSHVMVGPFQDSWDDGIVVGLMGLWMLAKTGKSLTEYKHDIEKTLDQKFIIVTSTIRGADDSIKKPVLDIIAKTSQELAAGRSMPELTVVKDLERITGEKVQDVITKDGVKLVLPSGWILLRPSGTEPAIKFYVEVAAPFSASDEQMKKQFDYLTRSGKELMFGAVDHAMVRDDGAAVEDDYVQEAVAAISTDQAQSVKRTPLFGGNLKMQKMTAAEIRTLVVDTIKKVKEKGFDPAKVTVFFAPSFIHIPVFVKESSRLLKKYGLPADFIQVAAQNVAVEEKGAFTGEVSVHQLVDAGVKFVIIGHSERRQLYGETDEMVNKKGDLVIKAGLTPVYCVGETLEQRDAGKHFDIVESQVRGALSGRTPEQLEASKAVIAYEPVWAIGTGRTATAGQAQEIHQRIRQVVAELAGDEVSAQMRIIYGGSVKPSNAGELIHQLDVDGGLVGGASEQGETATGIMAEFSLFIDNAQGPDWTRGGIDLAGNDAILKELGSLEGMNVDPAMIASFRRGDFSGFVPVIVGLTPVENLPRMLGM